MESSPFLNELKAKYEEVFPQEWIEGKNWDEIHSEESASIGIRNINSFIDEAFTLICKSVLSADYLRCNHDVIEEIKDLCLVEIVPSEDNTFLSKLQQEYIKLNNNLRHILDHYRVYVSYIDNKINFKENSGVIDVVIGNDAVFSLKQFSILGLIIEMCYSEYMYSYNDDYIKELIKNKHFLIVLTKKDVSQTVKDWTNIVIKKIESLLLKLSHESKNKKFEYTVNFEKFVTSYSDENNNNMFSHEHYKYYDDPGQIPSNIIYNWQIKTRNGNATCGEMALLMRFYTKKSDNIEQANNLLIDFDNFYQTQQNSELIPFNRYALNTVRNYLYNCNFSMRCKSDSFDFESFKRLLTELETIQKDTMIYNYHPYLKSLQYLTSRMREHLQKDDNLNLVNEMKNLAWRCLEKLKNNKSWCVKTQTYPLQLPYDECIFKINGHDEIENIEVFNPSSFCRPINFSDLNKDIKKVESILNLIEVDIKQFDEKQYVVKAKKSFEELQKRNNDTLAKFSAIVTFLVGCVTIFTNGDKDLTFAMRTQYVFALGIILLLFVSASYFFVTDNLSFKKIRTWFFLLTTLAYLVISFLLVFNYFKPQ